MDGETILTTAAGIPVGDNQNSRNTIGENTASESKCPFTGGTRAYTNRD
jgi:hypothetical protein